MQPDALSNSIALWRELIRRTGKVDNQGGRGRVGQGEEQLSLEGQQLQRQQNVWSFYADDLGPDRGCRLCQDPLQCHLYIHNLRLLPGRQHSRSLARCEPSKVCALI